MIRNNRGQACITPLAPMLGVCVIVSVLVALNVLEVSAREAYGVFLFIGLISLGVYTLTLGDQQEDAE